MATTCPNEFTKLMLEDLLDRGSEPSFGAQLMKTAVDVVVPQLRAPACEWAAVGTLGLALLVDFFPAERPPHRERLRA